MKQLKMKDLMLTGAFAALYFVCVGLGTLLGVLVDRSGNMMYAPAFAALLAGPVYMLLVAKIGRFGAISLVGAVMASFFFLSGYMMASFVPSLLFGILGDLVAHLGSYKSKLHNLLSYLVFSFGNLGPILLMWMMREAYEANLVARGKSAAYIARVMLDFSLQNVLLVAGTIVLAAVISGRLGQLFVKKYFATSGFLG